MSAPTFDGFEIVPHLTIADVDKGTARAIGIPTTVPGLAVTYTRRDVWTVTHLASGLSVFNGGKNIRSCVDAVASLADVDWERSGPEIQADPDAKAAVRAAQDARG